MPRGMMPGPMTSQGHAYAHFQRALRTGNLFIAESAARELQTISLEDALRLTLLYRRKPKLYERATARWIARYATETHHAILADVELVTGLLRADDWSEVYSAAPADDQAYAQRHADAFNAQATAWREFRCEANRGSGL
jgi:hypothetical protein